jgi:hypothetical protein
MPVKFKKGSKEAKAHMAKIRAMRGSGAGKHTDTKSHNVNIRVVSGNIGSLPFTGKILGINIKATKEASGIRLDIGTTRMGINKNTDTKAAISNFIDLLQKQYGYKLTEPQLIKLNKAAKTFIISLKKEAPSIAKTIKIKKVVTKKSATTYQTGSSNKIKDESRKALPPGKRKSASGKTYTERRTNRSDKPGSLLGVEIKYRSAVRVYFKNPKYNYTTDISSNVNEENAKQYFVGKYFNVGVYPKENLQKCTKIKLFKYIQK